MPGQKKISYCKKLLTIYNDLLAAISRLHKAYENGIVQKDLFKAIQTKKEIDEIKYRLFETGLVFDKTKLVLCLIYNCTRDQITDHYDEITDDTLICMDEMDENQWFKVSGRIKYVQFLNFKNVKSAVGLKLPHICSSLDLSGLSSAQGLKLPRYVLGWIDLKGLKSARGLNLPPKLCPGLIMSNLQTAEDLHLPQKRINGYLDLSGLKTPEKLNIPQEIGGGLNLSGLTEVGSLKFPKKIGAHLYLSGLTSGKGLDLSDTSIGANLYLNGISSVENMLLPKRVGGNVVLENLPEKEKEQLRQKYPQYRRKIWRG